MGTLNYVELTCEENLVSGGTTVPSSYSVLTRGLGSGHHTMYFQHVNIRDKEYRPKLQSL